MNTVPEFKIGQTVRVMHTNEMVKLGLAGRRMTITRIYGMTDGTKILQGVSDGDVLRISNYNCSHI